jgi:hypothetical protein
MKCDLPIELLSGYLDGELDVQERARVEAHLKTCPACQQELEALKKVDVQIRNRVHEEPTTEFSSTLNRTVMERIRTRRRSVFKLTPVFAPVAAALLILIVLLNTRVSGRIAGITDRIEYRAEQMRPAQPVSVPELRVEGLTTVEKTTARAGKQKKVIAEVTEMHPAEEKDRARMDEIEVMPPPREQVVRAIIDTTGTIIKIGTGNTLIPERDSVLEEQLAGQKVSPPAVSGRKQKFYVEVAAEQETDE